MSFTRSLTTDSAGIGFVIPLFAQSPPQSLKRGRGAHRALINGPQVLERVIHGGFESGVENFSHI
jgi:hypothetical protein